MGTGYHTIIDHYERCLARHGDSHLGVDWPNAADAETRYRVMLDSLRAASGRPIAAGFRLRRGPSVRIPHAPWPHGNSLRRRRRLAPLHRVIAAQVSRHAVSLCRCFGRRPAAAHGRLHRDERRPHRETRAFLRRNVRLPIAIIAARIRIRSRRAGVQRDVAPCGLATRRPVSRSVRHVGGLLEAPI